jgi:hypothetical protein
MNAVLPAMSIWRHDLSSCLQDALATVLLHHGRQPELVLGAVWDFYYPPGDMRSEEYYYPCRWPSLGQSLAPYHPITSRWHFPANAAAGWQEVREAILRGAPAIVAVDNYFLPFRPAYGDVHTNHLIIVYGFDEAAGEAYVLENKPPYFNGAVSLDNLSAARDSYNPSLHDRDLFYTNNPIGNRWLEFDIAQPFPELTRAWVREVVAANLKRYRSPSTDGAYSGMTGLAGWLADAAERVMGPTSSAALNELYVVGWACQQATGLHADFLTAAGHQLAWPRLVEIGRQVDRLAHHWSDLRMLGAHGGGEPAMVLPRVARRSRQLLNDQDLVLDEFDLLLGETP